MSRVAPALLATILLASVIPVESQAGREVKVVLDFHQQGQDSRQGAQGRASGVIIQDGKVRGRGGVAVQNTTTRSMRSEGVLTIALDGGVASMLVASEVPSPVVSSWFRDYATGYGYAVRGTALPRVGTTLVASPTILPNGQIRVRLTPQ